MTVQFIVQIVLRNVGVVKSDSKNREIEIAKYYFYQARIRKTFLHSWAEF